MYVDFNSEIKKKRHKRFRKKISTYKLLNKSVFGRTMENVQKHRNIKFKDNDKRKEAI